MNGPIGMSEEKDAAQMAAERAMFEAGHNAGGDEVSGVPMQLQCSPGMPERKAVARRRQRVLDNLHTLPEPAQEAIKKLMAEEDRETERTRKLQEKMDSENADQQGEQRERETAGLGNS
jgi:phospholipid/cholesterol/gamma-HCH transport system ATP-binding protein